MHYLKFSLTCQSSTTIGVFNEQDLNQITGISIQVLIREDDPLFDDKYKPITILFNVEDGIVIPKIQSISIGPVKDGLTILEHDYLRSAGQDMQNPGSYYLTYDLCETGEDEPEGSNFMNSTLKITIIKR